MYVHMCVYIHRNFSPLALFSFKGQEPGYDFILISNGVL